METLIVNYPIGFSQELLQGKHLEQDLDSGKLSIYNNNYYHIYYHFYYHSNTKPLVTRSHIRVQIKSIEDEISLPSEAKTRNHVAPEEGKEEGR